VDVYSTAYPATTQQTTYAIGDPVFIRAVVSDPFGSFDIYSATVTVRDASGTAVVSNAPMPMAFDSGLATKTFEYPYTIPSTTNQGAWTVEITANEGTEGTVSDIGVTTFQVVAPPILTVMKQASAASAPIGGNIIYTVTVTNTGTGAATSVVVSDTLSGYTRLALDPFASGSIYAFTDGANPSGLPGTGTVTYSCGGSPFGPATPTCGADDGTGHAINVDAFRITMDGVMNANTAANPSFQIQYQVQVK